MAVTAGPGTTLTGNAKGRLVRHKLARTRVVAALAVLVLVPDVIYLA